MFLYNLYLNFYFSLFFNCYIFVYSIYLFLYYVPLLVYILIFSGNMDSLSVLCVNSDESYIAAMFLV